MMSLVHPLSTGSASKFSKCFDGELFFPFSWFLCHVSCELKLVDVEKCCGGGSLKEDLSQY